MSNNLPPWLWPRAGYVHVPFCAHHCGYCDFAVVAGRDHLVDRYLDALAAELSQLQKPQPVRTLFLGGGTPTHLDTGRLKRLLTDVLHWLPLEPGGEFSVEANPDSLTAEKVAVLADHGVNRVSLGAQSFHPHLLAVLERIHSPAEVGRAVERIRARIPQVSLDLIFGVPGQSEAEWCADLQRALALAPDHVSTYGLTYEKGTRLWKQRQRGQLVPLAEEAERELYHLTMDTLEGAGFEQYEISNFARPGCRSRHNQVYWANEAYFGAGLGAARYVRFRREINTRDIDGYLRRALSGQPVTQQSEELPPEERARETMAVQLRRAEGIDRAGFAVQTGIALDVVVSAALPHLVEQGFLIDDGRRVYLSREGKFVADGVIERLMARGAG
jgi:oxygen-independent coproporphyrinogen-3 oxidase